MMAKTRGPTCGLGAVAAVVLVGVGVLGLTPQALAVAYTFTVIADLEGEYTSAGVGLGSINNAGTVAYVGTSVDGTQRVLKTSMDGTTMVIADTNGPLSNFYFADSIGTTPSINDRGMVGFVAAQDAGGAGIYVGNGGAIDLIEGGAVTSINYRPYLNSSGQVMYQRRLASGAGEVIVDTNGAKVSIAIADATYSYVGGFGINSAGQVLVRRAKGSTGNWYLTDGVTGQEIASVGGSSLTYGAISDYHAVFSGSTPDGGEAIYSARDGVLDSLIDNSGPIQYFGEFGTNGYGDLLFLGVDHSGKLGIYCGKDAGTPVLSVGDSFAGSRVTDLLMFPTLNDFGQFAFQVGLADQRYLLMRADPVPEPGSLCLLLTGLGALGLRRR